MELLRPKNSVVFFGGGLFYPYGQAIRGEGVIDNYPDGGKLLLCLSVLGRILGNLKFNKVTLFSIVYLGVG